MKVLGKLIQKGLQLLGLTDIGGTTTGHKSLYINTTTDEVVMGDVPSGGGGGGIANPSFSSFQLGDIDGSLTSGNTVYAVRKLVPFDVTVDTIGGFWSSGGTETITLGIYDDAFNRLGQKDLAGNPVVGINTVALDTPIVLTGGTYIWLAVKGSVGASSIGRQTCLTDGNMARSVFFGSAGLPDPLGGSATNQVPYIFVGDLI